MSFASITTRPTQTVDLSTSCADPPDRSHQRAHQPRRRSSAAHAWKTGSAPAIAAMTPFRRHRSQFARYTVPASMRRRVLQAAWRPTTYRAACHHADPLPARRRATYQNAPPRFHLQPGREAAERSPQQPPACGYLTSGSLRPASTPAPISVIEPRPSRGDGSCAARRDLQRGLERAAVGGDGRCRTSRRPGLTWIESRYRVALTAPGRSRSLSSTRISASGSSLQDPPAAGASSSA